VNQLGNALKYYVVLFALVGLALIMCSCGGRMDVDIHGKADLPKLDKAEEGLELKPKMAADDPHVTVVDGVAVERLPAYRIGAGDVLEVVYHIQYDKVDEPYRIQVLDRINVLFPFNPQFNASAVVRSDGMVSLPIVGDVAVESMTPSEVAAELTQRYSKYIIKPTLTVSLEESNVKVDELKKAITTAPRGQSKVAPVAPDGRVGFPIVGTLQAAGLTVTELEKTLNEKYKAYVKNLQVNVILNEIHNSRCYVLGEVERPGVFELPSREPLLAVLARAGSMKTTADLSEIVIFRSDGLERPMAIKVDLAQATNKAVAATNISVHPMDIIYVPKGTIDNMNDLISKVFTKGLYGIVPFGSSFSTNYNLSNTPLIK
jgi:polysaccharide export outer membrane protein